MKHLNILISGRVQGVGFRYSAMKMANAFSITGFVRNQSDGSVYIEAEGEDANLEAFLSWCRKGPGFGRVDNLNTTESNMNNFTGFRIR